ncbi:MAG: DUF6159 family protein [Gemmatimonadales bacterium]|nr:DUF6159 family protein [Gemmatimonadales bacterium]
MGSFFRVFGFTGQVLGMIKDNPMLLAPVVLNLIIAVPVNIFFAIALAVAPIEYQGLIYMASMVFGLSALYFIDYFAGGLTASMVYDQVTTGKASLGPAFSRTLRASPGILIFAIVSGILDFLSNLASQREGIMRIIGPIILGIIRTIWTTATYVMMPALVVEQQGFFAALKRSKGLMENDPTQVGVGVVGMGLVSWLLSVVTLVPAYGVANVLSNVHYSLGIIAFFTMTNLFWAISGYLKGVYYTCFYLWAVECERNHSASPQLAPAPLRNVIGGLEAGAY